MQSDNLPTDFDVVVLGTGMCESIVAAALARNGLQVLNIDRYENYGGDWASYNFSSLQQWIVSHKLKETNATTEVAPVQMTLNEGERLVVLPTESAMVSNVSEITHVVEAAIKDILETQHETQTTTDLLVNDSSEVPTETVEMSGVSSHLTEDGSLSATGSVDLPVSENSHTEADGPQETAILPEKSEVTDDVKSPHVWSLSDIKQQWRKFNIDLMPKLLYCRGPLVELLISSDVAKYCEFRSVSRVLTVINDKMEKVPCSRSDVFASHNVGVIEKRMLMKLLSFCLEFDKNPTEFAGFEDKPFIEFLKSKRLTDTVRHYVQHAIAMVPDTASTIEGLAATQRFLQSLGRYGNTAFLWPVYGSGELPQCFARMCAVFGGVYCLRRQATAAILDKDNRLTAVITSNGQRINTKWLVMEASYTSPELTPNFNVTTRISRAILLTDRSLQPDNQEHITLLSLPLPGVNNAIVTVYELSSISMACPDKLYVVHLICRSICANAQGDLQTIVESLFSSTDQTDADDCKPRLLWSLYFNVNNTSRCDLSTNVDNIIVIGGPDDSIDYDIAVVEAKKSFEKICPGEEFLPKAPNPEDIIYDDGEQSGSGESGFEASSDSAATAAAAAAADCQPTTMDVDPSIAVAPLVTGVDELSSDDVIDKSVPVAHEVNNQSQSDDVTSLPS